MRKPSRQMPAINQRPITLLDRVISITLGIGLLYGIGYLVWKIPLLLIAVLVALISSIVLNWRYQRRLKHLTRQRTGNSICCFAQSFDYRNVDTWVIRAVYEQIQEYVRFDFPFRASDRLAEDLGIDPEDLELNIAVEIAERTGRTLNALEINPYFENVKTVQDLVLFFNAQPRG
jgi:hypothetical protein